MYEVKKEVVGKAGVLGTRQATTCMHACMRSMGNEMRRRIEVGIIKYTERGRVMFVCRGR
jgi:hypothetical protein